MPELRPTPPSPLALRRLTLGFSQSQLGQATGLGRQTISRIENGHHRPQQATKTRLAAALDCSVRDLGFEITALKRKRVKAGFELEQLAWYVRMDPARLTAIENDEVEATRTEKQDLCAIFQTAVDRLFPTDDGLYG